MESKKAYKVLDIAHADKIGFIGDSYTESHFSVEGKAYICKLSLFSDYNYENFAKSGDTYRGNLDRIRKHIPIYHDKLSWTDIRPKFAFFVSYTNDLKYMDEEQYLNDLRATIETVKGLGAIPIIATEYHTNFGPGLQIGLKQIAQEYDCEFVDIIDDVNETRGTDFVPFWSGTHPGTRSNHLLGDNIEVYLNQLPRPRQSLKLFRLREKFKSIDELIFNTNEERARLFKEINVGHNCLVDERRVDDVTSAEHAPVTSEYLKLQNGEVVEFEDVALISAVLPSSSLGLEYVALDLGEVEAEVYVKDILKAPYPTPTFYQRFDIEEDYGVKVGDTYISDNPHFKDKIFTVMEVTDEAILALPYPRIATNIPGNLTKVSGEGAEQIPYPYTAIGFSNDYPRGKAQVGHYIKLEHQDGKYIIPKELLARTVDYDKVHFIVTKSGKFDLTTVNVEWDGVEDKVYKSVHFEKKKAKGNEMIPYGLMGNEAQLKGWKSSKEIQAYVPADGCLPKGCLGSVEVFKEQKLSQVIGYSMDEETRDAQVMIVARYFPEIFNPEDDYSKCKITKSSYDYAELCLDMVYNGKTFTQRKRVGMHWKKVNFDVVLPAYTDCVELRIYSEGHKVQVAKASMKTVER
ncbi:MAG: SGNH/GDSL hydrolase family protein [Cellulosilyticum sp.]|nr:SGNH/GDSL hydrolase family protein [Cellulosilyticum sp.]